MLLWSYLEHFRYWGSLSGLLICVDFNPVSSLRSLVAAS
jgi:hypothetical protein